MTLARHFPFPLRVSNAEAAASQHAPARDDSYHAQLVRPKFNKRIRRKPPVRPNQALRQSRRQSGTRTHSIRHTLAARP
ncbi:hypothetical protein BCAR13_260028 [Paraburkholderia caribensis]|nr:hypothetical protein BCAR13_260028 [Paraburkholderia caribensis]